MRNHVVTHPTGQKAVNALDALRRILVTSEHLSPSARGNVERAVRALRRRVVYLSSRLSREGNQ